MPDEQGRYHFDEIGYENLSEYLAISSARLSGPFAPNEEEETRYRKEQVQQEYLRRTVTV
jgi:hypothetical protein